jgi:sugar (pentulose or hexulose) kinase
MMSDLTERARAIEEGRTSLGIEFGSTRIKAVLIDEKFETLADGDFEWENHLEDGVWTYALDEVWAGLKAAYATLARNVEKEYSVVLRTIGSIGISAMMHGYLVFDKEGSLLVPFRTWRNSMTRDAQMELSELFQYNIPERWSIAHLYQAILNKEPHVGKIDYLTTLAGYVHWKLTGRKVIGVGDASGMFPVNPATHTFDADFIAAFDKIDAVAVQPWKLEDILPQTLVAGSDAGTLSPEGAQLLDPSGNLQPGVLLAPPEGDVGTGMVATNSVKVRTGNVSAGTSIFAMIVLENKPEKFHPEIDLVTTPSGDLAGMSHANNFTSDINAWVRVFGEFAARSGLKLSTNDLYGILFRMALEADPDAGDLLNYCFYSGEYLAGVEEGRPLFVRSPKSKFTLGNFMLTQLYSAFASMVIGMNVLIEEEHISIDSIVGHGGIFTTPKVAQLVLASVLGTPVTVMSTASEGGAWGMAVLADYRRRGADISLAHYLDSAVFVDAQSTTEAPDPELMRGFGDFLEKFKNGLEIEKAAIDAVEVTE